MKKLNFTTGARMCRHHQCRHGMLSCALQELCCEIQHTHNRLWQREFVYKLENICRKLKYFFSFAPKKLTLSISFSHFSSHIILYVYAQEDGRSERRRSARGFLQSMGASTVNRYKFQFPSHISQHPPTAGYWLRGCVRLSLGLFCLRLSCFSLFHSLFLQ